MLPIVTFSIHHLKTDFKFALRITLKHLAGGPLAHSYCLYKGRLGGWNRQLLLQLSSTSQHHTTKPAADPKPKSHRVTTDQSYAGTGAVGYCDPETQTIGLVGSQSNDSMQDTFLHEVFHAIVHVMDLKETESEENYVRRLATGLCTVWNQNPKGFKWWSHLV